MKPKYKLTIHFKEEDLKTFYAEHKMVGIAKHVIAETNNTILWTCFKPWLQNDIVWENYYSLYYSEDKITCNGIINKSYEMMAEDNIQYAFRDGIFVPVTPEIDMEPDTYYIKNNSADSDIITVGLAQDVIVNGDTKISNPFNAIRIPKGIVSNIRPMNRIELYVIDSDIKEGADLTGIDIGTTIIYSIGENSHSVVYNNKNKLFTLLS